MTPQRKEKRRLYRFYGAVLAVILAVLASLYGWALKPYADMATAKPVQMSGELYIEGGIGPVFDQIYFLEGPFAVLGDRDGKEVQKEYYFYYPAKDNEEGKFAIVCLTSDIGSARLNKVLEQSLLTDEQIEALEHVAFLPVQGKIEEASEELMAYAKDWVNQYWQGSLSYMALEDVLYSQVLCQYDYPASAHVLQLTFWVSAGLILLLWLGALLRYAVCLKFPPEAEDLDRAYAKQNHPCRLAVGVRLLYVRGMGSFRMVALTELDKAEYQDGVLTIWGGTKLARFRGLEEEAAREVCSKIGKAINFKKQD